jgi:XTP/dITP diphosphohydrolase
MATPAPGRGRVIILATKNAGKVREFDRILGGEASVQALPSDIEMPEETGTTFAGNARLKAVGVWEALGGGCHVLADDSGLEVDALGGRPGVHSARYAGEQATDRANVAKLLLELEGASDRTARFVCCLCMVSADGSLIEVSGCLEGAIAEGPRGDDGFGYDPVFVPAGWGETLGEVAADMKDAVSHRGAAAQALRGRLREQGWSTDDDR